MKRTFGFLVAMAFICLATPAFVQAQTYTLTGTVTWRVAKVSLKTADANSMAGKPVVGAKVRMGPGNMTATTDENGHFSITGLKRGQYTIHIKAKEHSSSTGTVVMNADKTKDFTLKWNNYRIGGKGNRNVQ